MPRRLVGKQLKAFKDKARPRGNAKRSAILAQEAKLAKATGHVDVAEYLLDRAIAVLHPTQTGN